ncbi:hypothetical protein FJQ98_19365 [Lysinibacillus agricola]|uniref:Uncharacterized protein n=1 Tax=Lysinibacillus agricola TaxID=2590012 RepID=A0ABX7AN32_9BACI|nr:MULTISPECIES: hypothetical protein [Lysinibacillus]KOS61965.1 hypothetical protein AN161_15580 [Lysinibacillus sp. FJAT-14222]QQP11353.1 hypothetical protein FJQ98_19365 [Lysinibacillus agricola]
MSLKGYTFKDASDFIYYLNHLLILTYNNLEVYERLINKLGRYIEEKNLIGDQQQIITSIDYEEFRAMLGYQSNYLNNLIGDHAAFGCSYQNYRKNIELNAVELNLGYVELSQDQREDLNRVTTARNWGNHVPVSLINSTLQKAYNVPIDLTKPIYTAHFNNYDGAWLIDMYQSSLNSLEGYKIIFETMKEDYSKLTGHPCTIEKQLYEIRDMRDLIIPKISADIQSKKGITNEDIRKEYEQN